MKVATFNINNINRAPAPPPDVAESGEARTSFVCMS
jgi:hypothetical protein